MKKHGWNVALFLIPIAGFALLNLLAPKDQTISLLEKRGIQTRPGFSFDSFFRGSFTKQYDNYFSDHFVFRDAIVELGSEIKTLKGIQDTNGATLVVQAGGEIMNDPLVEPGGGGSQGSAPSIDPAGPGKAADNSPSAEENNSGDGLQKTKERTYLVLKDRAMLLYHYSEKGAAAYAEAVNHLREAIGPDVRLYSLLVPSQVEFIDVEKYRKLNDSQKAAFESVNERYEPGIIPVQAYGKIEAHKTEYVYYRSDHHWTSLGAYYAYEAFAEAMGTEPVPLSRFGRRDIPNFLGSAYSATLNAAMKKNPDTLTTYEPPVSYQFSEIDQSGKAKPRELLRTEIPSSGYGGYAVFLGGDFARGRITTEAKNGKRLLILKDSYANAFIPFLVPQFEAIEILDLRYGQTGVLKLIKDLKITDILIESGPVVTANTVTAETIEALTEAKLTK